MKRFFLVVLFLGMLTILFGCDLIQNNKEITVGRTLSKVDLAPAYNIKGNLLKTYRYKNDKGITYVNIQEFLKYLKGGINNLDIDKSDVLKLDYTLTDDNNDKYTYEMTLNAKTNKVWFNDFDFLTNLNADMESGYSTDLTLLSYDTPDHGYNHEIDLNKYDLDIVLDDNNYYIPLYLANLFFSGSSMNVYEMGDKLYLIDNTTDLSKLTNKFKSNSDHDLNMIKDHTSKYLALYFDNFYGLKDFQGVDSYLDNASLNKVDEQTTYDQFYKQIDNFLVGRNDLHTSLVTAGYRDNTYVKQNNYSDNSKIDSYLKDYVNYSCSTNRQEISYKILDNTMVISINSFSSKTKDLIAPIMEKSKDYNDVIFDLSCNSGGLVAGVLEVLVYLTDQPIPMSYINSVSDSQHTEYYQATPSKYIDNNYYLRTSKATYSAANLFASIFKDMDLGPIMGSNTGGGAAAITYTVLPDGAIITNSSDMVFINKYKQIIENGIHGDTYYNNSSTWWISAYNYKNILENGSLVKFKYDNLSNNLNFNFSIDANKDDFEDTEFTLTFKNYHTGEIVKEYTFNDLTFNDSFLKPDHLNDYVVTLDANYTYKTIHSEESIDLGVIDKDLDTVGNNQYQTVSVDQSFSINSLYFDDIDVVKLNLSNSGLYTIQSDFGTRNIEIYDADFNDLGNFFELNLKAGVYYLAIENIPGDHDFIIKKLSDDYEGITKINLSNGENQNQALLDYYKDDETFEFTLDQDKIITLGFDINLNFQVFNADGTPLDSDINEYTSSKQYTLLFPKGTYKIKVYNGKGLVNFTALVSDSSSDLYTNDFSNDNFGELSFGKNEITLDYIGDQDIYYADITEKGVYEFEGDNLYIYQIDGNEIYNKLKYQETLELEPGRYYFAFARDILQKSNFEVEFNQIIDECDENHHLTINVDEPVTTKVTNELDKDYFDFTIDDPGDYRIQFNSDYSAVRYDLYDEDNNLILRYEDFSEDVTLNNGKYTMVLYQPGMNGDTLNNAYFTIINYKNSDYYHHY